MYNKILLTLDGSPQSEKAIPHAVIIAECFQAELIILKVIVSIGKNLDLSPGEIEKAENSAKKFASQYLDRIAVRINENGIRTRKIVRIGRPHEEIIKYAEYEEVDLLVMSPRGHSGVTRWLMGSVADRVTRSINVPTLLVRNPNEKPLHLSN